MDVGGVCEKEGRKRGRGVAKRTQGRRGGGEEGSRGGGEEGTHTHVTCARATTKQSEKHWGCRRGEENGRGSGKEGKGGVYNIPSPK